MHVDALPPEEREDAQAIIYNINALSDFCLAVRYGVLLAFYEYPHEDQHAFRVRQEWKSIAVRDVAMMIHHVAELLDGTDILFRKCPTIVARGNRRKLLDAQKLLAQYFPNHGEVRNAVGHLGGDSNTVTRRNDHGWDGWTRQIGPKPNKPMYERTFSGTSVTVTVKSKGSDKARRFIFRVESDTADKLEEFKDWLVRRFWV